MNSGEGHKPLVYSREWVILWSNESLKQGSGYRVKKENQTQEIFRKKQIRHGD